MTSKIDKAQKLEAEARRIRRAEKAFWREVKRRAREVEEYLSSLQSGDTASQSTEPYADKVLGARPYERSHSDSEWR